MKREFCVGKFVLIMMFCLAGLFQPSAPAKEPLVPIRSWQFHTLDSSYVSKAMKRAGEYNINTVVFSHGMIGEVSQLYSDAKRAAELRKLAAEAHDLGLKVWIWIHELEFDVPKRYLDGAVQLDRPGFWDWLEGKYDKLFVDYPEFDGILLTFHETKHKIFRKDAVKSKLSMPGRFAKMINTVDNACAKYKKDFVVRSFLYEPQELQWFADGLKSVHPRVMLQSKCVPHDWQPYYPHNPMIGKFSERKLIVEFDCSSEFTGRNRIPYTSPEYFEYRWRYDLTQPGVVGYNARLDHAGYDALYTPNEINIYALFRLTDDAEIGAKEIWRDWTVMHYGEKAAPFVEKALHPTFEAVNKSYFPLEFWITNHSNLPSFKYADGHLSSRTIAKWKPEEPKYRELEERLNHPDIGLLELILAEKDEAIALAHEAMFHLGQAKPFLYSEQYEDLVWRLEMLSQVAVIWKLHTEAFFGYKALVEGSAAPGLEQRVKRAIDGLIKHSEAIKKTDLNKVPLDANNIKKIADELRGKMNSLESSSGSAISSKSSKGLSELAEIAELAIDIIKREFGDVPYGVKKKKRVIQ